jgi:hypothetical protein
MLSWWVQRLEPNFLMHCATRFIVSNLSLVLRCCDSQFSWNVRCANQMCKIFPSIASVQVDMEMWIHVGKVKLPILIAWHRDPMGANWIRIRWCCYLLEWLHFGNVYLSRIDVCFFLLSFCHCTLYCSR